MIRLRNMHYFHSIKQSLETVYNGKKDKYLNLKETACRKSIRSEYGRGGVMIQRGYYCPSPILDLVVGGAKRGGLLKRLTKKTRPNYEYGFDENSFLVYVKKMDPELCEEEFIEYYDQIEYGLGFDGSKRLHNISKCKFDNHGRISEYVCGSFGSAKCSKVNTEIYTYETFLLTEAVLYQYMYAGESMGEHWDDTYSGMACRFIYDESGNMTKYYTSWIQNGEIGEENEHVL